MIPDLSLVLITAVVALVPAALLNLAVSRVGHRSAMSWPRLAILVTLTTLLCWGVVALVSIVVFSLKALGFTG